MDVGSREHSDDCHDHQVVELVSGGHLGVALTRFGAHGVILHINETLRVLHPLQLLLHAVLLRLGLRNLPCDALISAIRRSHLWFLFRSRHFALRLFIHHRQLGVASTHRLRIRVFHQSDGARSLARSLAFRLAARLSTHLGLLGGLHRTNRMIQLHIHNILAHTLE